MDHRSTEDLAKPAIADSHGVIGRAMVFPLLAQRGSRTNKPAGATVGCARNFPPMTIGYLTSVYARATHTFIRREVERLRGFGHTVHTFSIRRPAEDELVGEELRREHAATEVVLEAGLVRMILALSRAVARAPLRTLAAMRLAARIGSPGLKGRLWPFAYLLEAALLAERLEAKGVQHLHNHFGENSASVAMLASLLSKIPYSLTIHGPGEFDRPAELALGEKIHRAAFTVAVCEFVRSQLYRWSDPADWPMIHVVHCGLDGNFLGREEAQAPGSSRLICVGRLVEQKGQLPLVEAAGRLAAEGMAFELVLVGDARCAVPSNSSSIDSAFASTSESRGGSTRDRSERRSSGRGSWCSQALPRGCPAS